MTHVSSPVQRVLHGAGVRQLLPAELQRLGATRAVLACSATLAHQTPAVQELERALADLHQATYTGLSQHTPEAAVAELAAQLRELGADAVVSVGGGSVIDGCKAAVHQAGAEIVHLALPTTLSGAEFTASAGITDAASRQKRRVEDRGAAPRVVFLDPELSRHTPPRLWLGSGIRALDHAVETICSEVTDPLADHLAQEAIRRLRQALPACHRDPGDDSARYSAQLAAWWAALGLASVPMGPSHSLGKLLGAPFGIPHGITSCVLLPVVIERTAELEPGRIAALAAPFQVGGPRAVAGACRELVGELGLPTSLAAAGLTRDQLPIYLETVPREWRGAIEAVY
ncbi:MAG: iron-containing alcohol dehydrogenase [Candidatus Dormibacteria bacterium]